MEDDKTIRETPAAAGSGVVSPGTLIAGRYEVLSLLGSGGMGQVYRVVDRELHGETVALKLLHPQLSQDPSIFERFRNEVALARSLAHPNIVRTFDLGKAPEGYYYLTMEYVEGKSLKEFIEQSGALPVQKASQILLQILDAVSYAHEKGIIHRDLKPANVIYFESGEVKLVDFGTARLLKSKLELTPTGHIIGTPYYMSPEQIRGEEVDVRTDLYALGIIGYELAMGKRPFESDNYIAAAFKQLNEEFPSMSGGRRSVPAWYEAAVRKAAAKLKADRFLDAKEFSDAIRGTKKPEAGPASKSYARPLLIAVLLGIIGYSYSILNRELPWNEPQPGPPVVPAGTAIPTRTVSPFATELPAATVFPTAAALPTATIPSATGQIPATPFPTAATLPSGAPMLYPTVETPSATPPAAPTEFIEPELPDMGVKETPPQAVTPILEPSLEPIAPEVLPEKAGTPEPRPQETASRMPAPARTAELPGEVFFRRSGSLASEQEFSSGEIAQVRWSASIPGHLDDAELRDLKLVIFRTGETRPLSEVQGKLISLGTSTNPETRVGGAMSEKLVPGKYEAVVLQGSKRLAARIITVY